MSKLLTRKFKSFDNSHFFLQTFQVLQVNVRCAKIQIFCITGLSLDGMTLKEARKMLETVKEKLELVVTKNRDSFNEKNTNAVAKMTNGKSSESNGSSNNEAKMEAEEGTKKKSVFYFQP